MPWLPSWWVSWLIQCYSLPYEGNTYNKGSSGVLLVWHIPSNQKTKVCHTLHNVCDNCKKVCLQIYSCSAHVNFNIYLWYMVYSHVTQQAEKSDEKARSARCNCSSNYSWSKLSPGSQLKRRSSLVKERQIYMKRASTVFEHTGKLLCLGLHWRWCTHLYLDNSHPLILGSTSLHTLSYM